MITSETSEQRLIALNTGRNLARDSICRLWSHVDDLASPNKTTDTLHRRLGVSRSDLCEARRLLAKTRQLSDEQLRRANEDGTKILTIHDASYPDLLRQLDLPPPVLYCKGEIPESPSISIVGSRHASSEGIEAAEFFGRQLASRGLTVVSGFARGIDLAAHRGALSSDGGRTVAVLGCGIDVDYPRRRRSVRAEIVLRGALVTEFPFGSRPAKQNFPIRNRIIAALSLGTLIVQATHRSGSLITARLALDLGREIYAVPGSIFSKRAAGPNALIQDGAMLVSHPDQIVESLPLAVFSELHQIAARAEGTRPRGPAGVLLEALEPGQLITADQLASQASIPLPQVLALLMELELSGRVKRLPGGVFCRQL